MLSAFLDNFLGRLLAGLLVIYVTYLCVQFKPRVRVYLWEIRTWRVHFQFCFFFRHLSSRLSARLICLEEYVSELEHARDLVTKLARNIGPNKCEILVQVFTMQLPSDWPVWIKEVDDRTVLMKTPLGRYILGFKDFIAGEGRKYEGIKVNVKRCIVIDNLDSPNKSGEEKLSQLKDDITKEWYKKWYLKWLHNNENGQAFYLPYDKTWPNWLSDSVFFGIHMRDQVKGDWPRKWLWGFTTSYNPGEDVIIYRYHRLHHPGRTPSDFPDGVASITDMPDNKALEEKMITLGSLKGAKNNKLPNLV